MIPSVAIVFGTYNRLPHLKRAIESARECSYGVEHTFVIVDGGSTDGSREWLREQPDVNLICQSGDLTGAVSAFNLGFAWAVRHKADYVAHLNDDCEVLTQTLFIQAVDALYWDRYAGAVALATDTRGTFGFEDIHGYIYPTFGVVRREAGMAVARAQGDPTGETWWNPIYRTYAADSEFGCWLHKLGYKVIARDDLLVHDVRCDDELRRLNDCDNPNRLDSLLFWSRWRDASSIRP